MNHLGFIAAAYGLTGLVLAGMVAWLVIDGRGLARRLQALDARGVRRRSARPGTT
jgi:heme exporter protein D